jgi:hypothetical protein
MSPPEKAPKDPASQREAKLAQALRANLRRRKTGASAKGDDKGAAKSGDEN